MDELYFDSIVLCVYFTCLIWTHLQHLFYFEYQSHIIYLSFELRFFINVDLCDLIADLMSLIYALAI
jgi:hypothetical protein